MKFVNRMKVVYNKIKILKTAEIVKITDLSIATVNKGIKVLKEEGRIRRVGSNKTGYWEILKR